VDNLKLGDTVMVKATGQVGKVDQIRDPEPRYQIMFNNDYSTIAWKRTDELTLIEKPKT